MEGLYRIGVKVFCSAGADIDLAAFIPVFHRWIQQKRTPYLLIDVADYSHVPEGPGVMLVAEEGNFSVDEQGGRRGLCFYRKRPLAGELTERINSIARDLVATAAALSMEPEFQGKLQFGGSELLVYFNDRLSAPNTDTAYAAVQPALNAVFERAFDGAPRACTRSQDPRDRLTVTALAEGAMKIEELAKRLGASAS